MEEHIYTIYTHSHTLHRNTPLIHTYITSRTYYSTAVHPKFINDLPQEVISELLLYADDAKIYRTIRNDKDREMLQRDLHSMSIWSDVWLLSFHPDKLKKMTLSRNQYQIERRYHVGEDAVKKCQLRGRSWSLRRHRA